MKMTVAEKNGTQVVYLDGKLDSNTAGQIYDEMVKLAQESNKLVINLVDLEYISSAGLRIILLAAKLMKNHRGIVRICQPNDMVNQVLEVSGFNSLLDVYKNEEEALK